MTSPDDYLGSAETDAEGKFTVAYDPDDAGSFSFLLRETDRALESAEPAAASMLTGSLGSVL